jgi:alkanesulfonate monooxygenase SsuD/methylene tetrahydromethanopterin reductase-like flavin-dependent oxidoreductase (luciferase family)
MQKPHPPIIMGAHGPRGMDRVIAYCDGWLPIPMRAGDIFADIEELRRRAVAKGRDPRTISISVYGAPPDADLLRQYRDAGVTRAIFGLPSAPADKVLPIVDRCAEVARQVASSGGAA